MKKIILLVIAQMGICSSLMSMQAGGNFSRFCKFVNVGLAVGPSFLGAYKNAAIDSTLEDALDDADPITTAFAHEQLKKIGVEHPEAVIIKKGDPNNAQFNMYRAGMETIIVPSQVCDIIAGTTEVDEQRKERVFKIACSLLQHEGNHIKNNDMNNSVLCLAMIPFVSHPVFKLGASAIQKLYKFKAPASNLRMFGRNLGAGFVKMQINGNLFSRYSRYFEQRADDGVVDPQGLIMFLNILYYSIPEGFQREFEFGRDVLHPHPLERIKKLQERMNKDETL
jgi:hypothetical protein